MSNKTTLDELDAELKSPPKPEAAKPAKAEAPKAEAPKAEALKVEAPKEPDDYECEIVGPASYGVLIPNGGSKILYPGDRGQRSFLLSLGLKENVAFRKV